MTEATQMEVKANKGFKKRLFKSFKVRYFSVQPKERSAVQVYVVSSVRACTGAGRPLPYRF